MAEQGKRIMDVQVKTSIANTDTLVVIYNANTPSAQTAQIPSESFLSNISSNNISTNTFNLTDLFRTDPDHSLSLVIPAGQIFITNNYMYVAVSNNYIKRIALEEF